MISDFKSKQFVTFLIAGGFAAAVNFSSRFFYERYMSFGNAVILAYLTGMATAFVLNKRYVFSRSVHSLHKEAVYFTFVNVTALVLTYVTSVGLAEYVFPAVGFHWYPESVAHAIGIVLPAFTSFLGHKYWTFRSDA